MKRKPTAATSYRAYELERRNVETAAGLLPPAIKPLAPLPDQSPLFDLGPARRDVDTDGRAQAQLF